MKGRSRQPWEAVILIVEDNFNNFLLMTRLLAYLGVKKCEWKASGWKVMEFAETLGPIDLILMDLMLPDADGFESLESLRTHPKFKDVPIVAVTANSAKSSVERAREVGFDGFIGKPLDPDRFPEQVRRILAGEEVWEPE